MDRLFGSVTESVSLINSPFKQGHAAKDDLEDEAFMKFSSHL